MLRHVLIWIILTIIWGGVTMTKGQDRQGDAKRAEHVDAVLAGLRDTEGHSGALDAGETATHVVPVKGGEELVVILIAEDDLFHLELVTPSGRRITPLGVGFFGIPMTMYMIADPEAGSWTFEVTRAAEAKPAQAMYAVTVVAHGPMALTVEVDGPLSHRNGDPITITAVLSAETPLQEPVVLQAEVLLPDGSQEPVVFKPGPTEADAGTIRTTFTAVLTNTTQAGEYQIFVTAKDTSGTTLSNPAATSAMVTHTRSRFTGTYRDFGVDTNGDGLLDELRFEVGVEIDTPGRYEMSVGLNDREGGYIDVRFVEQTFSAGAHTVAFTFEGKRIFRNGVNGPYTLDRLVLVERMGDEETVAEFVERAHTTRAYNIYEFRHLDVIVSGKSHDYGVDEDGDGLFEKLVVEFDVRIREAGTYRAEAHLFDTNHGMRRAINCRRESVSLKPGVQRFKVEFDGDELRRDGADGPFQVSVDGFFKDGVFTWAEQYIGHETRPYKRTDFGSAQ